MDWGHFILAYRKLLFSVIAERFFLDIWVIIMVIKYCSMPFDGYFIRSLSQIFFLIIVYILLHEAKKLSLVRIEIIILLSSVIGFLHVYLRPLFIVFLLKKLPKALNVLRNLGSLELKRSCWSPDLIKEVSIVRDRIVF